MLTPHSLGYTLESWINLGASQIRGANVSASWRMPLAIPIAFSIMLMACIFTMPESPRCKCLPKSGIRSSILRPNQGLIQVGCVEEAKSILSKLKDLPLDDAIISAEIDGIQYSLEET